ncbi:hypothetical protein GCM10022393_43630 [Aquimarina addita]|uniref:Uncharacterized protein n=2 Tax=Pseudomonadati TaxID=3379134 RepID=A0ABP6UXC1_9FLAO
MAAVSSAIGSFTSFLGGMFNGLSEFRALIFNKGIAHRVASLTILIAAIAAAYGTIRLAGAALTWVMPYPIQVAASWVVPENWASILSFYAVCYGAIALYKWQRNYIGMSNY